jgi:hypothetical protein
MCPLTVLAALALGQPPTFGRTDIWEGDHGAQQLPRGRFLVNVDEAQTMPDLHIDSAYVTFITTASYVPGVEALLESLVETGTQFPLVILTPEPVPADLAAALAHVVECSKTLPVKAQVVHVPALENPYQRHQVRYGGTIMSKLYIFSERIGARRILYLDCDVLVLRSLDHLFQRFRKGMLSSAHDCGFGCQDHRPNTGVIGTMPDEATLENLLREVGRIASYDGADQGFLTTYFAELKRQGGWDKLPQAYNTLKRRYANEDWKWDELHVLHYVGQKPWQNNPKEDKIYFGCEHAQRTRGWGAFCFLVGCFLLFSGAHVP